MIFLRVMEDPRGVEGVKKLVLTCRGCKLEHAQFGKLGRHLFLLKTNSSYNNMYLDLYQSTFLLFNKWTIKSITTQMKKYITRNEQCSWNYICSEIQRQRQTLYHFGNIAGPQVNGSKHFSINSVTKWNVEFIENCPCCNMYNLLFVVLINKLQVSMHSYFSSIWLQEIWLGNASNEVQMEK
jgi:hypothetical protein